MQKEITVAEGPTAFGTRQRRRSRVRDTVLKTALDVLSERGLEGVAIREVARRLDYSPAAIYRYFESRDQIVEALAAESASMLSNRLHEVRGRSRGDLLIALGEEYLGFAKAEPVRFRLLFLDLTSVRSVLTERPSGDSPYRIVLEAAQAAIDSGEVSEQLRAETIAYALWATVHGMAVLEQTHLREFDADFSRAHHTTLELLVKSWSPRRAEGGQR